MSYFAKEKNGMSLRTIFIKNMVCPRCITAVEETLTKLNISYTEVKLGEVIVGDKEIDYDILDKELRKIGFELIQDKSQIIVERIKTLIIDFIHHNEAESLKLNFSQYLSQKLNRDYSSLSSVFSEKENLTIEKYIILQKLERVKELISYGELNFSEIAFKVNYSSVSHLSRQFKKHFGVTLSAYQDIEGG